MDLYAEITVRIIAQMEEGIIPWCKPWLASGKAISHATGKPYSLLNQMLLGRPGEYLTFKQCQEAGGRIRKGEKSSMVVFWKWVQQEDEENGEIKEIPYLRYYNVFHINQKIISIFMWCYKSCAPLASRFIENFLLYNPKFFFSFII